MSAKRQEQFDAPGQDAFLDVVANVVAILIILVIVVGSQAGKSAVQTAAARQSAVTAELESSQADINRVESEASAMEAGVNDLEQRVARQTFEISYRRAERDKIQLLVTAAEQTLAEHRSKLQDDERARFDLDQQLIESRGELGKLSLAPVASVKPPPTVLQHLPTPMAKTVFGTELHFRLQGGRLAYIPWEEMLEQLKADVRHHVQKLRDVPRVEISLPVISGFGARYVLRRTELRMETRAGVATQGAVELERMYFVDAEPNLGQPISQALQPGSELRSRLAAFRPQSATVTIWVYPDSFDDYRPIKEDLFKRGYLTAARPLPEGHPIGGSPEGTRSSAQ